MDRRIEKKFWTKKRILIIAGTVALAVLIVGSIMMSMSKSNLNVDAERVSLGEVSWGKFRELIPVTGNVMPISTIYLDISEGGRVDEIYVEDGAIVKKDQAILKLINTDLELSLMTQETSVYNLLTQMQIAQNNARQNTIGKLNQMTDVENDFREAERIYLMNKELDAVGAVSKQDLQESLNRYNYAKEKRRLTVEILKQDSISSEQQMAQAKQSYQGSQNALNVMRRKVADLIVRAPVEGQLTSLYAEIGQSKNKGERIGQVDVLSGFKVRADIDEHYISRILTGLEGEYKQGASTYKLMIKKVYTQVTAGRFPVDMVFVDSVPEMRRGQSLQIRLALSDETEALLLPRGAFFRQTGGNWIFKLNSSGDKAERTPIRIGRQNPEYYEVLEGLQAGDKVVTNSYENYGEVWILTVKK